MNSMDSITHEQLEAVDKLARVDEEIVRGVMARVPAGWDMIERLESGATFRRSSIQVLFTVQRYGDGRIWLHCSACGRRGENSWFLPDWEQLKRVKHDFIGPDRWAYQVLPASKDYVNQHPYVLHLYALLDGEPALPDFTYGLGKI